jgi:hypothetical protein
LNPFPPEPANSPPRPPLQAADPVQLNASKLYPLPTNNPASGRCAVPLENNTDKPPSTGPCFGADPTTFAEGPDTTPAGTTPAGTAAPNNAFGVGTTPTGIAATGTGTGTDTGTPPVPVAAGATLTAAGTGTGGSPDRADRAPLPAAAARTTPPRTTPSARTADAGPAIPSSAPAPEPRTAPAEPRPDAPPPRREDTGPLSASADRDEPDPEESPRPPSA